jgi:aminoglycoside N3'-acetyltransferase
VLVDLVGVEGTIVMNTDGITHENVFRAWAGQVESDEPLFDHRRTPSRRGLISELFRRRPSAIRSVHPWYNMTAEGPRAEELLCDDVLSTPYAMDEHSSTYKLTTGNGKVVLLGSGFDLNVPMHLIEYVHPDEFPRPVYVNRPSRMTYVARDGSVQSIDVLLHASIFYVKLGVSTHNFCTYLQSKYGIYRSRSFARASIVAFDAREQYDVSLREMRDGVTQYDPRFQVQVEP